MRETAELVRGWLDRPMHPGSAVLLGDVVFAAFAFFAAALLLQLLVWFVRWKKNKYWLRVQAEEVARALRRGGRP